MMKRPDDGTVTRGWWDAGVVGRWDGWTRGWLDALMMGYGLDDLDWNGGSRR